MVCVGLFETNWSITMHLNKMTKPAEYVVYVEVSPYPNCGFTGTFTSRVGPAKDLADAKKKIADDRLAMGKTFGGLIEPVTTKNRKYRVFRSLGWEELQ